MNGPHHERRSEGGEELLVGDSSGVRLLRLEQVRDAVQCDDPDLHVKSSRTAPSAHGATQSSCTVRQACRVNSIATETRAACHRR